MIKSNNSVGDDWPSQCRTAVNYWAGFAYTAVRREHVLKSFSYLRQPATYDIGQILDRFESTLHRTRGRTPILNAPQTVLELLVDLTFILHAISIELHRELADLNHSTAEIESQFRKPGHSDLRQFRRYR